MGLTNPEVKSCRLHGLNQQVPFFLLFPFAVSFPVKVAHHCELSGWLSTMSAMTLIVAARSRCSVNTGWKNGYFNHCSGRSEYLRNIWIFQKLLQSAFQVSDFWIRLFHYRLGTEHPALTLLQTLVRTERRSQAISSLYLFLYGPRAKSSFYKWTFAPDLMLGFKHQWSQKAIKKKIPFFSLVDLYDKKLCIVVIFWVSSIQML